MFRRSCDLSYCAGVYIAICSLLQNAAFDVRDSVVEVCTTVESVLDEANITSEGAGTDEDGQ